MSIFKLEKQKFDSITFIFCTDRYLLAINEEFLGHNYYTDIVTFNLAESNSKIIGEVYISVERVRDNAKLLGEPVLRELKRVIFHGVLHLCGYKDKSIRDINIMRSKEELYLKSYSFLTNVSRGTNH